MRILQVIPSYLPATRYGGPIFSTHALSKALVERGHAVEVYTTYGGQRPADLPPGRVELDGVVVNYFKPSRSQRLAWAPGLREKLGGEIHRFDIVHLHTVFLWPTWCAGRLARAHGIPYIVSPRGMLVKELISRRNRIAKSTWIKLFEKENLARAAAIHVTASREAEDLAEFNWSLPPVVAIPNGIDWPEVGGAVSPDIAGVVTRRPYALFFGRLSWKKGIDRLLEAFARTRTGYLVIAGTDDEGLSQALRKSINALALNDRVQVIARTIEGADKYELFKSARLFALPSLSENFGNSVLEALAAGLPALVTPEVGAAEIVLEAGAGLVVPRTVAAWTEALEQFLSDEHQAQESGRRGRAYVAANCSWKSAAARMESLYQQCLRDVSTPVELMPKLAL
jgi:glycosyltransferase involved in cell wall biosynthesis